MDFSRPHPDGSWERPNGQLCNWLIRTVALLLHIITIITIASGQCFLVVQTVAILHHDLPYQELRSDGVALSSRQLQLSSHICVCEENSISCRTLMSVWTSCHDVRTDATLNCLNLLDTNGGPDACLGHPEGSLGSDFSELKSTQNLLLSILNHFSEMKTLK
jgi:hypothetical protein